MNREFERVAIVNRGEAAVRFIHAAREFNQEHGSSLRTIALFTEPDRRSLFRARGGRISAPGAFCRAYQVAPRILIMECWNRL